MSASNPTEKGGTSLERLLKKSPPTPDQKQLPQEDKLAAMMPTILAVARELHFLPTRQVDFSIEPTTYIDEIAAFALPGVAAHWTGGEDWYRLRQERAKGSRIYELVVNTDPVEAFLGDNNDTAAQVLVITHVLGHAQMYENCIAFAHTDPYMGKNVQAHADRIYRYEDDHGVDVVEDFRSVAKALEWNIDPDPNSPINRLSAAEYREYSDRTFREQWEAAHKPRRTTAYDDLLELDKEKREKPELPRAPFPSFEERDLLRFIRMFSPDGFEPWQADVLDITRKMMEFLWPNTETQIMNEGWATYVHITMMREFDARGLFQEELGDLVGWPAINAGVLAPNPLHINPYELGNAMWKDIERKRLGLPREDGKPDRDWMGEIVDYAAIPEDVRAVMFDPLYIMATHRDASFIREFLTPAIIEDLNMYQYGLGRRTDNQPSWDTGEHWRIKTREARAIIEGLAESRMNNGGPLIVVAPGGGDYNGRKELHLLHKHEGAEGSDLNLEFAQDTLTYVYQLWRRPVHLETVLSGKRVMLTCRDGKNVSQRELKDRN